MSKTYTLAEQKILRNNHHIIFVSETTIRFSKSIIKYIEGNCTTAKSIRVYFKELGIPVELLRKYVIKNLYKRYCSRRGRFERSTMSKKKFSNDDIKLLEYNENIVKVSASQIQFKTDFQILIAKAENLTVARELFLENNINLDIIGESRFEKTYYRLRNKYKKFGEAGFSKETRGRKPTTTSQNYSNMSDAEKIAFLENQLEKSQYEVEFLKKYMPSSEMSIEKSKYWYESIFRYNSDDGKISPCSLLKKLNLNLSGYYRYVSNNGKRYNKYLEDLRIVADISYISDKFKNRVGYRQIKMKLDEAYNLYGFKLVNHKRIQRLMRMHKIHCKVRRQNPYRKMIKATHENKIVPNLLNRQFKSGMPRTKLLTDITYLKCSFGMAYLSVVKDSVTNEIIAHTVRKDLGIELSLDVVDELNKQNLNKDVMIHSDQGVHYTSNIFRERLELANIKQSMSRKGNCWDNAPMESFFGHFKDELEYSTSRNIDDLKRKINDYMIYYNCQRKQWKLNKMTPEQVRCHLC